MSSTLRLRPEGRAPQSLERPISNMLVNNKKLFYLKLTALFFVFVMAVIFLLPNLVFAQVDTGLGYLEDSGLAKTDIRIVIANIIRIALGLLGTVAVVIILYGGFVWMTAGGNEENVATAKKILVNGVIGLVIIILAFSIASFVLNSLRESMGLDGSGPAIVSPPGPGGGGLGYGVIQNHYPERDARGIARNTKIAVTFKRPINAATVIEDSDGSGKAGDSAGDRILTRSVRILIKGASLESGPFVEASGMVTEDQRTFVFKPLQFLGSSLQETDYIVYLSNNIKDADNKDIFTGRFDSCEGLAGYCWQFRVGTFADTTPPKVTGVFPFNGSEVARNAVVQINFSEAIDPISASGIFPEFENINIKTGPESPPEEGNYRISNEYRTVEFITNNKCGTNSCGQDVFCLPSNSGLIATARSIDPDNVFLPYSGVVDMSDNPLDGDGDGAVDDKTGDNYPDNYSWLFNTNNTIDLEPPRIESMIHYQREGQPNWVSPSDGEKDVLDNIDLAKTIEIYFSKVMMFNTINNSTFGLNYRAVSSDDIWDGWFYPVSANERSSSDAPLKTITKLRHGEFNPDRGYEPSISSQLKDIYQNCFWDPEENRVPGPEILIP